MSGAKKPKVLLFVPMYNCENQIGRVLGQIDAQVAYEIDEVIVVDNRSTDGSQAAARAALDKVAQVPARLLENVGNYGLGGSHKVAFQYAARNGFDYLIVLHGDDQGDIHDLLPLLKERAYTKADCLLGARFMPGSRLQNYSTFRTFGNEVFNWIFSVAAGKRLYDLGSGLNMYSVKSLQNLGYLRFANDLTFNYYMILATVHAKWNIRFVPISWREDDQISNVKLFRQARRTLGIVASFFFGKRAFLATDHSGKPDADYRSEVIASNTAARATTP